ncbi:MAG: 16S rRNA (guanine(966)-N(2))-methyltransferase RsmD [candidate division KSB1 bacterium]|nr:16S rRNA (guanine(966)-N(2))-methyltransferase RsmD [candidate division KSB1 bacterium]MDZ7274455.1 16S rRNA (guanine(966)-N(2))-methyltransferase RsmD [candidate division KSB1 bacterium]MDZ7284883.1 16S rRNA (guanine(966)-N(2))-methyltransferase RsmD [candidate division KSB1 bacterium]MDZ7297696.1 16S rRNA (guanine(966)-N(2))-methyltransferase RsmD [candidate division KSB1 bacterium]MDZ7305880.1 16S rRNA (guanine(966)-N(2))-methyltransferase RsmD [candidate division KSB1 bacterium]
MRVIAGTRKGHVLLAPRHRQVRPTSSRVRTVLFDVLGRELTAARVLDLFAGTGGLGIEALSRGAAWVDFVESNRQHARLIRMNLQKTHLDDHAAVLVEDAFAFLARRGDDLPPYDLVLADPPYTFDAYSRLLQALATPALLAASGRVVLETSIRLNLPAAPSGLQLRSERRISETRLLFYQRE